MTEKDSKLIWEKYEDRFNSDDDEPYREIEQDKAPGDMTIGQAIGYPDDAEPLIFGDLLIAVKIKGQLAKYDISIDDVARALDKI